MAPPQAIWGATKKPLVCAYIAPYPRVDSIHPEDNEKTTLDKLGFYLPYLSAITNAGYEICFQIDIGWDGRRNFDPAFVMTNKSTFMWDTNMFPDGMPWLINKLATNGIGTILGAYYYPTNVSAPASGITCKAEGSTAFVTYTNGVGPGLIYSNSLGGNFKSLELICGNTISNDFSEFRWWGVRGIILNDCGSSDTIMLDTARRGASGCLRWTEPQGFNGLPSDTYFSLSGSRNWGATNGWTQTGSSGSFLERTLGYYTNLPACTFYPYMRRRLDNEIYGTFVNQYINGCTYENFNAPFTVRQWLVNFTRDYAGITSFNQGAHVGSIAFTTGLDQDLIALFTCQNFVVDSDATNNMSKSLFFLTNAVYSSIALDPLQAVPYKAYDVPGLAVAIVKPMTNGDTAVLIQYEGSTNTAVFSLNYVSDLGLPVSQYTATSLQYAGGFGLIQSQHGTNMTLQFNTSSTASVIIRLTPTNAISASQINSGTVSLARLSGVVTNIYYTNAPGVAIDSTGNVGLGTNTFFSGGGASGWQTNNSAVNPVLATNGVSIGSPGTNNNTGLIINTGNTNGTPNGSNSTAYWITTRQLPNFPFPVAALLPVSTNEAVALDLNPSTGARDYFANGVAFIDLCSTNCQNNQPPTLNSLRLQVSSSTSGGTPTSAGVGYAYVGSQSFNGATPIPFCIGYNGRVDLFMNATAGIQVVGGLYAYNNGIDMGYNGGSWGNLYLANANGQGVVFQNGSFSIVLQTPGVMVDNAPTNIFSGKLYGNGIGVTNTAQNTVTFTNFLFGSLFTNTSTRNELVSVNARCNPTATGNALFALVTSPTGGTYTTSCIAGLEADTIFTTGPHGWYQATAQVPPGGIWQVVDKTGEGLVTISNSFYTTLQ